MRKPSLLLLMHHFLRKLLLAIGLTAVLGTAPVVWASHFWGNDHWERESNSVTLELGDNIDLRWDE